MADDEPSSAARQDAQDAQGRPTRSKRLLKFGVVAAGALIALYFAGKAPRDQHVRMILGPGSERVRGLEIQYIGADGELARAARMAFDPGGAPRVVSHEPQLADGDYRLQIDLEIRDARRSTERRVTLGGGTTQVDLARVIAAPPEPPTAP